MTRPIPDHLRPLLADVRAGLEALYGDRLAALVLFGSQARGDATPDSDVDVLVVLHGVVDAWREITYSGPVFLAVSLDYDVLITPIFTQVSDYVSAAKRLMHHVHRDGIAL